MEVDKKTETKKNVSVKIQKKTDRINLSNVKLNFSKGKKSLLTKESKSRKKIYIQELSKADRSKIRNQIERFANNILGKDRSENERKENVNFSNSIKKNGSSQI